MLKHAPPPLTGPSLLRTRIRAELSNQHSDARCYGGSAVHQEAKANG